MCDADKKKKKKKLILSLLSVGLMIQKDIHQVEHTDGHIPPYSESE